MTHIDSATSTDQLVEDVLASATGVRIGGTPVTDTGSVERVASPLGDEPLAIATGTTEHARAAAAQAATAMATWATLPATDRAAALRSVADRLEEGADGSWARLVSRETGKRLVESQGEIRFSAGYFRVAASTLLEQEARDLDVVPGIRHQVVRQPRGVATVLTPWNFPVSIPARKIAPALAAGCGVVFKPSEVAPLSSMVLSAVLDELLPEGLIGTVLGPPTQVVDEWLAHPAVGSVTFTGSTRVGRIVSTAAATRFLPAVLELGGCAPFVVLADADPEAAVEALMVAKFRNNGQSCIAANQIFIAREIANAVLPRLRDRIAGLRVGDPLDSATDVGPLAPAGDPARMEALIQDAVERGATVVRSEGAVPSQGHYVAPALLINAAPDSAAMSQEIFGPVAPIRVFDDFEEMVQLHRATGFGLAAYVCTADEDRARAVAGRLNAGIVGINTGTPNTPHVPFGGRGESGVGYEGGPEGLEFFQAAQVRAIATR